MTPDDLLIDWDVGLLPISQQYTVRPEDIEEIMAFLSLMFGITFNRHTSNKEQYVFYGQNNAPTGLHPLYPRMLLLAARSGGHWRIPKDTLYWLIEHPGECIA